jgi:hypothetical protein
MSTRRGEIAAYRKFINDSNHRRYMVYCEVVMDGTELIKCLLERY